VCVCVADGGRDRISGYNVVQVMRAGREEGSGKRCGRRGREGKGGREGEGFDVNVTPYVHAVPLGGGGGGVEGGGGERTRRRKF
jgi:hypothetical protein